MMSGDTHMTVDLAVSALKCRSCVWKVARFFALLDNTYDVARNSVPSKYNRLCNGIFIYTSPKR